MHRAGDSALPFGRDARKPAEAAGGIAPLPLMEDLDLVLRLRQRAAIRCLGQPLTVDGRRWRRLGVLGTARRNAALRRAWRRGCSPDDLAAQYYGAASAAHPEDHR